MGRSPATQGKPTSPTCVGRAVALANVVDTVDFKAGSTETSDRRRLDVRPTVLIDACMASPHKEAGARYRSRVDAVVCDAAVRALAPDEIRARSASWPVAVILPCR